MKTTLSRRQLCKTAALTTGSLALGSFVTGCASTPAQKPKRFLSIAQGDRIDLTIAETELFVGGQQATATTINGGVPGPLIRLKEGQNVKLIVHNKLDQWSSIHWHGLLVPPNMDGVPGVSFKGIAPGKSFQYQFKIRQSGTYWYHSHSGFQEQLGVYGAIVIEPKHPIYKVDRDHVIVLSDWTFEDPAEVLANLKRYGGYYNFQRRTLANLGDEAKKMGFWGAISDRLMWSKMRMDSTDLADVTGITYTYLMNGLSPQENWRGLFKPGERIRLRFINASAATHFDIRIPGLNMKVIQTDGMNIVPVDTDEFRIATAETYDVIVEPTKQAYTIFAETMDRSGFARGTLATSSQHHAKIPTRRKRPLLTMADMGMMHNQHSKKDAKMGHTKAHQTKSHQTSPKTAPSSQPMKHHMPASQPACVDTFIEGMAKHSDDEHGAGNTMVAKMAVSKIDDPGVGLRQMPWKVLTYSQLRRLHPAPTAKTIDRTIELHLTGNMERYMWSFDGVQYRKDMPPITLKYGERIRFVLINDTMMPHPIHLHGMFFEMEVGACQANPLKHTINVKPAERASFIVTANEIGRWAFHCHILYHMSAGMFRVVEVKR